MRGSPAACARPPARGDARRPGAGSSPAGARLTGLASGWLRYLLLGTIVLLLAALFLVPTRIGPETLRAVEELRARTAVWPEGPLALLAGEVTRDQLVGSLSLGQQRFEAALAVALGVGWLTFRLHRLTRQLQTRAERLRESEERFRLIAENLREMIWISDPG